MLTTSLMQRSYFLKCNIYYYLCIMNTYTYSWYRVILILLCILQLEQFAGGPFEKVRDTVKKLK